ncbi:SMP-30/gluconolactonase/LRE family protein [Falsiroseomonas ponticola]|uniref:SMP-30/gluconolactonase/LRE family protein n=1 Tax=Falsiroseomonas ponticola TaxID=2786951 RepID=UPI00193263F0|nr:SMP-30/gluconolactonase/LRE family protein [Roseomonas ponticola]
MWTDPPRLIQPSLLSRLPEALRRLRPTAWADANRAGQAVDSFLEGPCFDAAGNLYCTDIPHGRVFRVAGSHWEVVAEYEGWPNGLAARGEDLLVADYRHGLLTLDPVTGAMAPLLETILSEGLRGINDLILLPDGGVVFTDQGQTGLQDPTGRVWRLHPDGRMDKLIGNGPSPNGLVMNRAGTHLMVAMTRSCEIWRFVLRPDAVVAKANLFFRIPAGTSGPDGLAVDAHDRLFVANPGHGQVWVVDAHGLCTHRIDCTPFGRMPTNCTFAPDGRTLVITESQSGSLLAAEIPSPR